jgi:hypothetical protein
MNQLSLIGLGLLFTACTSASSDDTADARESGGACSEGDMDCAWGDVRVCTDGAWTAYAPDSEDDPQCTCEVDGVSCISPGFVGVARAGRRPAPSPVPSCAGSLPPP